MITPLMFSDFLREVIFAMRRLEAIDRPPCLITIGTIINRWGMAHDDGWELYNTFLKWYWEFGGSSPDKWAKNNFPRLVAI